MAGNSNKYKHLALSEPSPGGNRSVDAFFTLFYKSLLPLLNFPGSSRYRIDRIYENLDILTLIN